MLGGREGGCWEGGREAAEAAGVLYMHAECCMKTELYLSEARSGYA